MSQDGKSKGNLEIRDFSKPLAISDVGDGGRGQEISCKQVNRQLNKISNRET